MTIYVALARLGCLTAGRLRLLAIVRPTTSILSASSRAKSMNGIVPLPFQFLAQIIFYVAIKNLFQSC
jgi:hypothetical protein